MRANDIIEPGYYWYWEKRSEWHPKWELICVYDLAWDDINLMGKVEDHPDYGKISLKSTIEMFGMSGAYSLSDLLGEFNGPVHIKEQEAAWQRQTRK